MEPLKTITGKTISREIEKWVKDHSSLVVVYDNWYIGITSSPDARKSAHKSKIEELYFWLELNARSVNIARAIKTKFHKKGMLEKDLPGGIIADSKYVYVYKKHAHLIDILI